MKGLNEFDQVLNEDHQRSKTKQTKNRLTTYIEYLKKKNQRKQVHNIQKKPGLERNNTKKKAN